MKLTASQYRIVAYLRKYGAAHVDGHGRLCSHETDATTPAGACISALKLVAAGLVTGRNGLLVLTEAGMRHALPQWPAKEESQNG